VIKIAHFRNEDGGFFILEDENLAGESWWLDDASETLALAMSLARRTEPNEPVLFTTDALQALGLDATR